MTRETVFAARSFKLTVRFGLVRFVRARLCVCECVWSVYGGVEGSGGRHIHACFVCALEWAGQFMLMLAKEGGGCGDKAECARRVRAVNGFAL